LAIEIESRRPPVMATLLTAAVLAMASPLLPMVSWLGVTCAVAETDPDAMQINSDMRIRIRRGRDIEIEVRAAKGDSYAAVARRVAGGLKATEAISAWNGDRPLEIDDWIRVPLALLSDDYRALVLVTLFPDDRREGEDWIHIARSGPLPTYDAGLWQVAEWFTGDGDSFAELMRANSLNSPELSSGQTIRVPGTLLHASFQGAIVSADGSLEYGADEKGPYAAYRLKRNEALYSAVVVRYTGRTKASDVVTTAELIKERSGIRDLRDIPVGFKIKIPLDLLQPEFLPAGHPLRVEAEAARDEVEAEMARLPVATSRQGLEGVVVILDPGHGGRDLGTMNNGIWEHDYVYDVTCRLKQRIETRTAAKVQLTLLDEKTGCSPSRTDKLKANHQGTVQTHPPFLAKENGEAKIGVNLRWYLANAYYRNAVAAGTDPSKIVFMSIHADARHASLAGVMVYVPGAAYIGQTHGFKSKTYAKYSEVKQKQFVSFTKKQRVRSEAISRKFAAEIVDAFRAQDLPIQPYQPVRNRIIRGRSIFVPAVLRGNVVPNKVLVEMVNISNHRDAALLASARDRERLAEALYQALLGYYGSAR
jgi:N-acetylmuramoyl-L-alanine amidase